MVKLPMPMNDEPIALRREPERERRSQARAIENDEHCFFILYFNKNFFWKKTFATPKV